MYEAFKLVDADGYSRKGLSGETLWLPVGTRVKPTGPYVGPCNTGVLHGYVSPEIGMIMNPLHADITHPKFLHIASDQPWETDGLKRWTRGECTTLAVLPTPDISIEERVAFAICVAPHPATRKWAVSWLSGKDGSKEAAKAQAAEAAAEAEAAEAEATWATEVRAAKAAKAATWAAEAAKAATWATEATWAAEAAKAATWAAKAWAAKAATWAAEAGFEANLPRIFARACAILRGEIPAEEYDKQI